MKIGLLKKKAWKLTSEYVRLRDCLETTGTLTEGKCYTCGKRHPLKELQAGHLLDGHIGMNYLDERGIKIQCVDCNCFLHGNKEVYIPKFIDQYGKALFEELQQRKRTPCLWKQPEYEKFIEEVKQKIAYIKNL